MPRAFVRSALGLLALAVFFVLWAWTELHTPFFEAESDEIFVAIPSGADSRRIAQILAEHGVLRATLPFRLYLRWAGMEKRLKAGEYRFDAPATPVHVADRISRGDVFYRSVTIPEGLTAREVVKMLTASGLSSLTDLEEALEQVQWIADLDPEARNLEGYIFPDTYRFARAASADEILRVMVHRFRTELDRLRAETAIPEGWTVRSITTLASMIEKETGYEGERGLVASVLKNRLARGIPLACDPTIIYALKVGGRYDGNLRKPDLQIRSPYNTYLYRGLPPGPIANPGASALRAALISPRTEFLYFVARNDGTHHFSKDLRSHTRAVNRYQKSISR